MSKITSRVTLRKTLRAARNALSSSQQQHASLAVRDNLLSLPAITHASSIACYLPNDGEVDLRPFMHACWELNKGAALHTSLPVLHPVCKGHLLFLRYTDKTPMRVNKYNIEEPILACPDVIPTFHHQVILMPLVGFDANGNRLGMGGGYYDRTLASIQTQTIRPKLIGIAHDCQQVDQLPVQHWDIPVNRIVTPTQQLTFNRA
ncbi:5-formyltetrahydrofolate cyclo-ligase [Alteromonas sp. CI.11.F.A3]|uniref:5-formyltetrahydrofolate cyclo-ligase n=1 Tax=Alteromonas sp. CI.11.F.A3 TaxID=3079555 RepID=UPI002943B86A|nr:5-formyltetrahydrofolate cyclo-ligase [Alteromonas sp. CI.11.F.A3]WOI38518.1 5-formyltetrahydrofolate cyclo-ligase [Alteromonas sp. CI.11.F.A3]